MKDRLSRLLPAAAVLAIGLPAAAGGSIFDAETEELLANWGLCP